MLTVGTDAYSSLVDVDAYHAARGNAEWAAVVDATREVYIRKGTDWVDRTFTFIGDMATGTQRLKWPRKYAEIEGNVLSDLTIPWQVAEATAIIADLFRLGTYDMEGIVTTEAAITSQKVDVIEVHYDTAARIKGPAVPSHVYALLQPLTNQNKLLRA